MSRECGANPPSTFEQDGFSRPYALTEAGRQFLFDPASLAVVQVPREVSELAVATASLGQSEAIAAFSQAYGTTRAAEIVGVLIRFLPTTT